MERSVRCRVIVAPPQPLSASPAQPSPTVRIHSDRPIARLPTAVAAYVFSHCSARDHAAFARTCVAHAAVSRLGAASPRLIVYSSAEASDSLTAEKRSPPLPPVLPAATGPSTRLPPHIVQQLIDSGCLGPALTALDLRLAGDRECSPDQSRPVTTEQHQQQRQLASDRARFAIAELERLATAAPLLTYLGLRIDRVSTLCNQPLAPGAPFVCMTALGTLVLDALPDGGLLALPPALHTLRIGDLRASICWRH